MVIRPRQQAATPSLCEDTHYLFPQRGPRLERELACHSTASRSAFEGNETAPPLEGVAAELATQTGAYDTNLTVTGSYEITVFVRLMPTAISLPKLKPCSRELNQCGRKINQCGQTRALFYFSSALILCIVASVFRIFTSDFGKTTSDLEHWCFALTYAYRTRS